MHFDYLAITSELTGLFGVVSLEFFKGVGREKGKRIK